MPVTAAQPRTNRDVLTAYARAKGEHDVAAALELCHPDYFYETAGVPDRVEGRDAARAFYQQLFDLFPDYFGEFDGMLVEGDTGIAWGRFGGTSQLTGKRIELPVTFVCTFRDGLIASDTGYFDSRTFYELAGLPHPADAEAAGFVGRFEDAWRRRERAAFAEVVTDDVDAFFPGMSQPGGKEDALAWLDNALAGFPDIELSVQRWARTGDAVLIEWRASATVAGEPLDWGGCDRFTLRDGRGVEERVYFDTAPITAALARGAGATPSG